MSIVANRPAIPTGLVDFDAKSEGFRIGTVAMLTVDSEDTKTLLIDHFVHKASKFIRLSSDPIGSQVGTVQSGTLVVLDCVQPAQLDNAVLTGGALARQLDCVVVVLVCTNNVRMTAKIRADYWLSVADKLLDIQVKKHRPAEREWSECRNSTQQAIAAERGISNV